MALSSELQTILEYRGVEGIVAAEVTTDTESSYATGSVFAIAGVAEIQKTTESSNEAHYYDNIPAIVISSTSADTVTISASAIPLDVLGTITGQKYDETTGALIEGERTLKYFAIGYKTQKNDGSEVYVWRLKGSFNIPDQTNTTRNDSTDANGQELVFTGISTTHKFTNNDGKGAKALIVDVAKELVDVSTFFDAVVTPDTLGTPVTKYTVTNNLTHATTNNNATQVIGGNPYAAKITADATYTLGSVTVTMGGANISSSAVNNGAITIPSVSGNIVITATASN